MSLAYSEPLSIFDCYELLLWAASSLNATTFDCIRTGFQHIGFTNTDPSFPATPQPRKNTSFLKSCMIETLQKVEQMTVAISRGVLKF